MENKPTNCRRCCHMEFVKPCHCVIAILALLLLTRCSGTAERLIHYGSVTFTVANNLGWLAASKGFRMITRSQSALIVTTVVSPVIG